MSPAKIRAALPLGWAALLLYLTLAPADRLPPQPQWELLSFDTFCHAAFFAAQAALTWPWLRQQRRWPKLAQHATLAVLLGCTVFGALIEALQMALPFNRHGEWSDLLSDSIGTGLALALMPLLRPVLRTGRLRWWLAALFLAALLPLAGQAQDIARARRTIADLAAPSLHGRGYVQDGDKKAAAYLRGRLKSLKLEPLVPEYTQPFTLDVNAFPGKLTLQLQYPILAERGPSLTKPTVLATGVDFIAAASAPTFDTRQLKCIRLDSADAHNAPYETNWLRRAKSIADNNRAVIIPAKLEAQLAQLPAAIQEIIAGSAAKIILVSKLTASISSQQSKQVELHVLDNKKYFGQGGDPRTVTLGIQSKLQRNYPTQNLAAIIRGSAQPDSFLIISAHYDHLGMMGKKAYFPGANDNASGVAMLLELAAHYAQPENRPACSVVFLLFGAEEAGLVGSRYFVEHPLVPLKQIKFLMNLDLLGTGEEGATVVNGKVHEAAFQRLQALNTARHYLPALGARGKAANSDHYPFSEAGVPAFFLYTRGGSKAYHDVNDTPDKLSLAGFAGAFGLVRDFLNEMGAVPWH